MSTRSTLSRVTISSLSARAALDGEARAARADEDAFEDDDEATLARAALADWIGDATVDAVGGETRDSTELDGCSVERKLSTLATSDADSSLNNRRHEHRYSSTARHSCNTIHVCWC